MANDPRQPVSDTDRFLALKALREYLFLHHPARYSASDFIEDIPQLRPYGSFMHDALPSAAVMDYNPESRHRQIQDASQRVKELHGHGNLPKEMAYGAATMGVGSIPISLLFGGASRLLGKGKGIMPRFRGREMVSNPNFRYDTLHGLGDDVTDGVLLGSGIGAAIPLASHQLDPSDEALGEAGKILQKAPYTTGLPGADVMAAYGYNKKETKTHRTARNVALGAGMGAGAGALGGLVHSGTGVLRTALQRAVGLQREQERFHVGKLGKPSLLGAGIGAGVGMLTSALLPDQY